MPRRRDARGGFVYHVTNRAVRRATLFFTPEDHVAFLAVLVDAAARFPSMRLLSWEIMKNHWHLVVWPRQDGELSDYVGWFSLTHACRWQRVHGTRGTGYVYQGRFNATRIESVSHLFIACAYVESNAFDKHLVARAQDWPWSSAAAHSPDCPLPPLHEWPVPKPSPEQWRAVLNQPGRRARRLACQQAAARLDPSAAAAWHREIAEHSRTASPASR